ncbi:hypothetical protein CLI64_11085 [Nostoc sp. CENA543]|uniref:phage major capsid protein n=1 Tax=Nostoc sp. CENA543 TaxID=1869241 RepID=UPI000CA266E5|nr:phage major capsid protein [Nostoc sp. CENA543]AUT00898.1 hypothetical protein CLI64_11085 [Nostoc sp. CENA543]
MATIISPIDALQFIVDEEVAQVPLTDYPMLNAVQKRVTSQTQLKWNVNVGGAQARTVTTSAAVTAFNDDDYVQASLAIGRIRVESSFQLLKEDIAEARAIGKGALRDLFASDVNSAIRVCLETMATGIYSGTGANNSNAGIVGVDTCLTATTYAGIAQATYTGWTPVVNTNGTNRALTTTLLEAVDNALMRKGGTYNAIFCSPELVSSYRALFAAQANIQPAPLGQSTADIGYTGIAYKGRPIIADIYAPLNKFYFVDSRDIELYTFGQNNTDNRRGIQFAIGKIENNNPDAEQYVVYAKPQLKIKNRPKSVAGLFAIT